MDVAPDSVHIHCAGCNLFSFSRPPIDAVFTGYKGYTGENSKMVGKVPSGPAVVGRVKLTRFTHQPDQKGSERWARLCPWAMTVGLAA